MNLAFITTSTMRLKNAEDWTRDAADIIHALASPEVYGLLVLDRGWSAERYETWLRQILVDQLLPRDREH